MESYDRLFLSFFSTTLICIGISILIYPLLLKLTYILLIVPSEITGIILTFVGLIGILIMNRKKDPKK